MKEKQLQIGKYNINYKEYGSEYDQVIFIIHGWGGKSDSWMESGELLSDQNYRVIIPDLPGFGKTEIKSIFTLDDYVLLIENFIKELGIKNFIIWGHSNGGAISIKLTNRCNFDISRLVLNNSAGIRNDHKRSLKRKILGKVTKVIKKIFLPFLKEVHEGGGMKKLRNLFYRIIGSHDYLKAEQNPYLKQTYLNMISSDLTEDIQQIKVNTLLIWGEKDTYTPLTDGLYIRKLIPQSKLVTLADQKHGIHLKNPKLLINAFINNI